jgi:hypothetical protein
MTNAADGNEVLMFSRSAHGSLSYAGAFATGGLGSGDGLGNQGAVVLSKNNRWLFTVNAGSNEISVFAVRHRGLKLVDTIDSGGLRPISLTVTHSLNGGNNTISAFRVANNGRLFPIDIAAAADLPAEVNGLAAR